MSCQFKRQDYYCVDCEIHWTAAYYEYCGCAQWIGDETDVCPICGKPGIEDDFGMPEPALPWEK